MKLGKTLGIFALGTAVTLGALNMPAVNPNNVLHNPEQPRTELTVEQHETFQASDSVYYNEIHTPGRDAIQQETNNAGITTMAPTKIASHLDQPSVEGRYHEDFDSADFSARFSSSQGEASFEVLCTTDGIGDALLDAHGPLTVTENGIGLQRVGNRISSDWVQMDAEGQSHCLCTSEGMTMEQTVEMANSLQAFTPVHVNGAYIAQ